MNALKMIKKAEVKFGLSAEEKKQFIQKIWDRGGEGAILKHRSGLYEASERRPTKDNNVWLKAKKTINNALGGEGVDAWVSGFVPGQGANEGMIGALEFSVYLVPSGRVHRIGSCSNFTREERISWTVTNPDGSISLKPEMYDRVAEITGMDVSSSLEGGSAALVHCRFVRWREGLDSKPKEQCVFSEALLNDLVL